ncbi:hypothetical protein QHF83_52105 [Polyangium sp. 15x6]|nr:hypothetical protein [Polyangium sp. 15x6]
MDEALVVCILPEFPKLARVIRDVDRGFLKGRLRAHEIEEELLAAFIVRDSARGNQGGPRRARQGKRWEPIREPAPAQARSYTVDEGMGQSPEAPPTRRRIKDRISGRRL